MGNIDEFPEVIKRAMLVGVVMRGDSEVEVEVLLDELGELVSTLGIEVGGRVAINLKRPSAGLLLGSGRAEQLVAQAKELDCQVIIFDNELFPGQQRNWEKLSKLYVIDRQEVILDIFAERAQTKEAVLQVQLAKMEYALPRLRRAWTHLSRQRGGSAMQRGDGETQLEADQRIVRNRIARLKKELKEVVQHRGVQRKQRMKIPIPTAAIVGYTNAGKSSLLNCLTGSTILAEDKLFATLDPTTRRLELSGGLILLVTDTVGFVRRLPHRLVEAFKATLEEAVVSDFLIHVVDISSPDLEQHMETTLRVMKELGAEEKKILTVFNKVDIDVDAMLVGSLRAQYPEASFVSTVTKEGVDGLVNKMEAILANNIEQMELLIPHDRYDLIEKLHQGCVVRQEEARDDGVYLLVNAPKQMLGVFDSYKL